MISASCLPYDVFEHIATFLDTRSVCALGSTCRRLRDISCPRMTAVLRNDTALESFATWVQQRPRVVSLRLTLGPCCDDAGLLVVICAHIAPTVEVLHLDVPFVLRAAYWNTCRRLHTVDLCSAMGVVWWPQDRGPPIRSVRITSRHRHPSTICFGPRMLVERLDMSYSATRYVPACLQYLPRLRDLVLDGNCMTSHPLPPMRTLESLSMRRCFIIRLPDLRACPNIRHLDISHNSIGWMDDPRDALEGLSTLEHLESLDVSHNILDGYALAIFREMKRVPERMDISCNCIFSLGGTHARSLAGVHTLTTDATVTLRFLQATTARCISIHARCRRYVSDAM